MKKIYILIPLVLFCIGGLFFFLSQKEDVDTFDANTKVETQDFNEGNRNKNETTAKNDDTSLKNVPENSRVEQNSVSKKEEDMSFYASAVENNNILECDKIQEQTRTQECRDTIFLEISLKENSLDGCKKIEKETLKNYCSDSIFLKKGEQEKKFDLCEKIISPYTKYDCLERKDSYLSKTALRKEDCSRIVLDKYKEKCTRRFFTESDFAFDTKVCAKLEDAEDRFLCEKMTISSAFSEGKSVNCRDFTGATLEYCIQKERETNDEYFFEQAVENKNNTYCKKIVSKDIQEGCITQALYLLVWEKKDISFCKDIPDKEISQKCTDEEGSKIDTFFYRKAMRENNQLLCTKIGGISLQKKCIQLFIK